MPLIDLPLGWQTAFILHRLDAQISEPAARRVFRRLQMARIERLAQADRGQWFGLWCKAPHDRTCAPPSTASTAGANFTAATAATADRP